MVKLRLTDKGTASFFSFVYKALAILVAISTVATFAASIVVPLGIKTAVYISYIVLDTMLVYGFWNMRKWIVVLMGLILSFLMISNIVRILQGAQNIKSAAIVLIVIGMVFLFTLLTKSLLNGEFRNIKVIRVFIIALIISQILFIF